MVVKHSAIAGIPQRKSGAVSAALHWESIAAHPQETVGASKERGKWGGAPFYHYGLEVIRARYYSSATAAALTEPEGVIIILDS